MITARKRFVFLAGDMGAARPDIYNPPVGHFNHASSGNPERAHIERLQVCAVPAHLGVLDHDLPIFDH
ncbi:hypothetical protein D3C77_417780 [compost metagenome]